MVCSLKKSDHFFYSIEILPGILMKQTPSRFLKFAFFLCVFNIISIAQPQTFFPDTGTAAIVQRCRDLRGSFHVLSIALRPGDEDFSCPIYLRLERGAKVLSAYVTNGETEESDSCDFIPQQNAVIRREEAASHLKPWSLKFISSTCRMSHQFPHHKSSIRCGRLIHCVFDLQGSLEPLNRM